MNPATEVYLVWAGARGWRVIATGLAGATVAYIAADRIGQFLRAVNRPVRLSLAPRSAP